MIFCSGELPPIETVVCRAFDVAPVSWGGSLHVYLPGKIGELVVGLGLFGPLGRRLPQARVVLHTLPHYASVVARVAEPRPSKVVLMPARRNQPAVDATEASFVDMWPGYARRGDDLHVSAFRAHGFYASDPVRSEGPWYRAFADSVGVVPFDLDVPRWLPSVVRPWPYVLALATANRHSSRTGGVGFSPEQWRGLADAASDAGLEALATGSPDDGLLPRMPGWRSVPAGPVEATDLAFGASVVVGGNSGLVWASALVGGARVVMLDNSNRQFPVTSCPGIERVLVDDEDWSIAYERVLATMISCGAAIESTSVTS
jgi:hypothetical protein